MIVKLQDKKLPKRNKDKGSVLERYYKSFLHAIDGIIYAAKYEHNIIIIMSLTEKPLRSFFITFFLSQSAYHVHNSLQECRYLPVCTL